MQRYRSEIADAWDLKSQSCFKKTSKVACVNGPWGGGEGVAGVTVEV